MMASFAAQTRPALSSAARRAEFAAQTRALEHVRGHHESMLVFGASEQLCGIWFDLGTLMGHRCFSIAPAKAKLFAEGSTATKGRSTNQKWGRVVALIAAGCVATRDGFGGKERGSFHKKRSGVHQLQIACSLPTEPLTPSASTCQDHYQAVTPPRDCVRAAISSAVLKCAKTSCEKSCNGAACKACSELHEPRGKASCSTSVHVYFDRYPNKTSEPRNKGACARLFKLCPKCPSALYLEHLT